VPDGILGEPFGLLLPLGGEFRQPVRTSRGRVVFM
jgi:hypothetical protein